MNSIYYFTQKQKSISILVLFCDVTHDKKTCALGMVSGLISKSCVQKKRDVNILNRSQYLKTSRLKDLICVKELTLKEIIKVRY